MPIPPLSRKDLIRRSAKLFARKPAIVAGDQWLTFAQVDDRANRLANALRGLGLKPRDRVSTLMHNCLQYPEVEFALVKASLPQITLNPRLTPPEQLFQIQDTQSKALIVEAFCLDVIGPVLDKLKGLKVICFPNKETGMLDYEELLAKSSTTEPEGELEPEDVGEIRYTSGTTGQPKGIILPYWSRVAITRNFFVDHMNDFSIQDRFLALQPFYHGAGWFIFPAWVKGATNYVVPRFDPDVAFDTIEKHQITVVKTVPTVLVRLLDAPDFKKRKLGSLRTIMYGGSPMPVERLKEAMAHLGPIFLNVYGQMEAAMTISLLRKEEHTPERLGSVGRPCTFVQVRVVDNNGNEVPAGEVGEVILKGDHQMLGYYNRPEATAQTLRNGWIYTNDLGKFDKDGFLFLTGGRKSEMIISGGLNIYPAEVEQALFFHPAVAEAAVIGVQHPIWGEAVKACVVLKKGKEATEAEIIEACRGHVADYKRPKSVDFLDELPHNAAGKISYAELRKKYRKKT